MRDNRLLRGFRLAVLVGCVVLAAAMTLMGHEEDPKDYGRVWD